MAHLDETTPATLLDEEEGQDAQFHIYQSRVDSRGERVLLQVGAKSNFDTLRLPSHAAALVLTRYYSESKDLVNTELAIRSPYLKKALREIVQYFPSVDLECNGDVELLDEPWLLFHYRNELQEYARASNDQKVQDHIKLCLQYVGKNFRKELMAHDSITKSAGSIPTLEHRNLWIVYKPGDLMYQYIKNQHSITRLVSIHRHSTDESSDTDSTYYLTLEQLRCNGTRFGFVHIHESIEHYKGNRSLSELEIYPFQYHAEQNKVRSHVLERGKKVVSLHGTHHKLYETPSDLDGSKDSDGRQDEEHISVKVCGHLGVKIVRIHR